VSCASLPEINTTRRVNAKHYLLPFKFSSLPLDDAVASSLLRGVYICLDELVFFGGRSCIFFLRRSCAPHVTLRRSSSLLQIVADVTIMLI